MAFSGISKLDSARLNLIPEDKRLRGGRPSLVTVYVLLALLLIMLLGLGTRSYFQQRSLEDRLDARIGRLQGKVEEVVRLRNQITDQQAEVSELRELMSGRQQVLLVLRDLTERIPDDTYLQNLQIQGEQVTMTGYSDQASSLLPTLQQSPYLESVKQNWINQDRRTQKDRFNFAATIKGQ
jgi:general secretion pathway protein L